LQKLRKASFWEDQTRAQAKIFILEKLVFQEGPASGDRNARYGFEHNRIPVILFQAFPGYDDPVVGGFGVDLCCHYWQPEAFQVSQNGFRGAID
jgi:hypothetical protein